MAASPRNSMAAKVARRHLARRGLDVYVSYDPRQRDAEVTISQGSTSITALLGDWNMVLADAEMRKRDIERSW